MAYRDQFNRLVCKFQSLHERMENEYLALLAQSDRERQELARQLDDAKRRVAELEEWDACSRELISVQQRRLAQRRQAVECVDPFICERIRVEFGHYVRRENVMPADYHATLDRLLWCVGTDVDNIYQLVTTGALAYWVDDGELQDVHDRIEVSHCS